MRTYLKEHWSVMIIRKWAVPNIHFTANTVIFHFYDPLISVTDNLI